MKSIVRIGVRSIVAMIGFERRAHRLRLHVDLQVVANIFRIGRRAKVSASSSMKKSKGL